MTLRPVPSKQPTPKQIAWACQHIRGFKEMLETQERVEQEKQKNRKEMLGAAS